jgi:glycogen operon protein
MILDCLRYWVEQMHVDGFRFDLAASLSRGEDGQPLAHPPLLLDIDADPVLARTKIIAEAWDAGGLYEVANFPGERWAVWNGRFRDTVRQFVKSDPGTVGTLADCLVASANLFKKPDRWPSQSINFFTAHDGFTLNDLVSYDDKHNEANGEQNHDGSDQNFSWNCGVEGPSDNSPVETLRRQQIKNFFTLLLFSEGRPMLLMGDEVRRTQHGNNNAYCQDSPTSWFDWDDVKRHAEVRRFVRGLIRFHQKSKVFRDRKFWGEQEGTTITWHGVQLHSPQWDENSHSLAYELFHAASQEHLHVILNAYWEPLEFELPATAEGRVWQRMVDTAQQSPVDFCDPPIALAGGASYLCQARSSVVLISISEDKT